MSSNPDVEMRNLEIAMALTSMGTTSSTSIDPGSSTSSMITSPSPSSSSIITTPTISSSTAVVTSATVIGKAVRTVTRHVTKTVKVLITGTTGLECDAITGTCSGDGGRRQEGSRAWMIDIDTLQPLGKRTRTDTFPVPPRTGATLGSPQPTTVSVSSPGQHTMALVSYDMRRTPSDPSLDLRQPELHQQHQQQTPHLDDLLVERLQG
ncbi:hypothetical protein HKX48_009178, partial [Thoreauomyces humboldtii]